MFKIYLDKCYWYKQQTEGQYIERKNQCGDWRMNGLDNKLIYMCIMTGASIGIIRAKPQCVASGLPGSRHLPIYMDPHLPSTSTTWQANKMSVID